MIVLYSIGVGESVCRIICKAVIKVIGPDVMEVAGSSQLCAGQDGGCEAAVHAVRRLFESSDCEAVLLIDVSNAFNFLNRHTALRNILNQCPGLATIAINCYRLDVLLFIDGEVILSSEGTTQGDPLAMAIYAIGILPLIHHLNHQLCTQVWYADDAAVGGSLSALREWWDDLCSSGPMFDYYPNASKSFQKMNLLLLPLQFLGARTLISLQKAIDT